MHFKEVTYKRNFRVSVVDQYLFETIETTIAFDEGEDAKLAFAMAKQFVLEQGSNVVQYPEHLHIEEKYTNQPLPDIHIDREVDTSLEQQIMSCTEFKVLESYYLIVKNNPSLQSVYDIKKKELVAKESKEIVDKTNALCNITNK